MSTLARGFVLVLGLLVYVGLYPKQHEATQRLNNFNFTVGALRAYTYEARFEIGLGNITDPSKPISKAPANVSGTLLTKVLGKEENSATLAVQMLNVSCPEEQIANPNCSKIYGSPFLLKIKANGEFSEYLFSNQIALEEERKIKGLLEPLSLSLKNGVSWQSSEKDSLGTSLVQYSFDSEGQLTKKRIDYLELNDGSGFLDQGKVRNSSYQISYNPTGSWIDTIKGSEEIRLYGSTQLRASMQYSINLKQTEWKESSPELFSLSEKDLRAFLTKETKQEISQIKALRAKQDKELIKASGVTLDSLTKALSGDLSAPETLARAEAMTNYFNAEPKFLDDVSRFFNQNKPDDLTASKIIYAIQNASSPKAQEVLLDLSSNKALSESTQKAALSALGFTQITESTEEALWKMSLKKGSPLLEQKAEMALFALGNAAGHFEEDSQVRADKITARLNDELQKASNLNSYTKTEVLLMALGNTTKAENATTIEAYLSSESDEVRRAAAIALGTITDLPSISELSGRLLEEESPKVRLALAATLNSKQVTAESFAIAAQAFVEENEPSVRISLAKYLAKARYTFPEQRGQIDKLIKLEQDPMVYKALAEEYQP